MEAAFTQWAYPSNNKFFKKIWQASFQVVLWSIWKERNARVFSNLSTPVNDVKSMILLKLSWWIKAWEKNFPYSSEQVIRNPCCLKWKTTAHTSLKPQKVPINWLAPKQNILKWNVDASFHPQTSRAAIGGVLRNEKGDFLCLFSCPIPPWI